MAVDLHEDQRPEVGDATTRAYMNYVLSVAMGRVTLPELEDNDHGSQAAADEVWKRLYHLTTTGELPNN